MDPEWDRQGSTDVETTSRSKLLLPIAGSSADSSGERKGETPRGERENNVRKGSKAASMVLLELWAKGTVADAFIGSTEVELSAGIFRKAGVRGWYRLSTGGRVEVTVCHKENEDEAQMWQRGSASQAGPAQAPDYKPLVVVESASARFGPLVDKNRLGVVITVKGTKPPAFTLQQLKLHVLGNEVSIVVRCATSVAIQRTSRIPFSFGIDLHKLARRCGGIYLRRWSGWCSVLSFPCRWGQIFVMCRAAFPKEATSFASSSRSARSAMVLLAYEMSRW